MQPGGLIRGDLYKALSHLAGHGWIPLNLLAPLLDLSEQTVYQHAKQRKIPTVKVGRDKRVDEDTVMELLKKYGQRETKRAHINVVLSTLTTMKRHAHAHEQEN